MRGLVIHAVRGALDCVAQPAAMLLALRGAGARNLLLGSRLRTPKPEPGAAGYLRCDAWEQA